ncbi:hypothetical protein PLESTM_001726200 [Pleodorina starrii]|nr:hypothetical protein PLESTM_001726200 [Pleodorina starrii]
MGCNVSKTDNQALAPTVAISTAPSNGAIKIHEGDAQIFAERYGNKVLAVAGVVAALAPDPLGVGGILSKAFELLKQRSDEAITNTANCRKLLETANWSRTCLTGMPDAAWADVEEEKSKLEAALEEACVFLKSFGISNFLDRLLHAGSDAAKFTHHSEEITKWTQRLTMRLALREPAAPPPTVSYSDVESEKLRAAICKLGGSTDVEEALVELKRQGRLGELTQYMRLPAQVQMEAVEAHFGSLAAKLEKAVGRVKLPEMLPPKLKTFWLDNFNTEEVSYDRFCVAVAATVKDNVPGLMETVRQRVCDVPELAALLLAAGNAMDDGGNYSGLPRLLWQLLQAYTNPTTQGKVHVENFYGFWFSCREWAVSSKEQELPDDVLSCFKVLARHFDPKLLLKTEKDELQSLWKVLQPFPFESEVNNLFSHFQPGSRSWLFEEFAEWLALSPDNPSHRAMVLYGGPGLGKSTVVAALVAKKAVDGRASAMAGHWFCKHNDMNRSNLVLMIRTFAYQLAEVVPALRPHLLPPKLTTEEVAVLVDVETAFDRLLLKPLNEVDLSSRPQPLVLVIDALDEVAVAGGSSQGANPVLRLIREHFPLLPPAVRFVFTSRPEPHIMSSLDVAIRPLKIQPDDPRHKEDLRALIQHKLASHLDGSDITRKPTATELSEAVQLLLDKSEGVFVYLARLLEGLKAKQRWTMKDLRDFPQGLYATYTDFMERLHSSSDSTRFAETELSRLLSVLLAVQEPPTLELLTAAWNATEELPAVDGGTAGVRPVAERFKPKFAALDVNKLLDKLGSLYLVRDERVVVFHKSFHDFLESPKLGSGQANEFWVDPVQGHTLLAAVTAQLMASPDAARAAWPSSALPSKTGSMDMQLSPQPRVYKWLIPYSLKYGPSHLVELQLSGQLPAAGPLLGTLVQNYAFLAAAFSSGNGHDLIRALSRLRRSPSYSTSIPGIVMDALRWMLLRQPDLLKAGISEEQVLVSCLCCPLGTLVFEKAKKVYVNALESLGRPCWTPRHVLCASTSWPACQLVLSGHSSYVHPVAWSPDGRQLASGSGDMTLRVWDAASGACVATLEGHSNMVTSVAWSPDGRQLASGSWDETLRVWDAASGACVATLEGHSSYVLSVAWSPDGRQLASGSWDKTLRVWDAASGACVATLKDPY